MVEPVSAIKAGAAVAAPTGRVVRKALKDNKRHKCLAGFLRTAIAKALADSSPDVRQAVTTTGVDQAVTTTGVDKVVEQALRRAREEVDGTTWRKLPQRIVGKLRHRTQDLSLRTSANMQPVITRWIMAGLPPGDYDWRDLAERSAAGFRDALYEEQKKEVIDTECGALAIQLEKAFQENDALREGFSKKEEVRKTAAVVATSGVVVSTVLGTVGEIQHNMDFIPGGSGVLGLSVIAAVWLGVRAHQQPRWDQAAALELTLDTARDWVRDVHARKLDPVQARQLLRDRVTPRLANWDVPMLDAVLCRIADLVEDRACGRASFNELRLSELFAQAAKLLSVSIDLDLPAGGQLPAKTSIAIENRDGGPSTDHNATSGALDASPVA